MTIRVALVEDVATLRKRFEERFTLHESFDLTATYASGEAAIAGIPRLAPDRMPGVVLMDIRLPGISGIETTRLLKESYPDIEIIMLTMFEDEEKIFQSIAAGASGYLLKDDTFSEVDDAIKEVIQGGAPMSQSIARKVLAMVRPTGTAPQQTPPLPPAEFSLTERELELIQGLVSGETYTAVAERLFLSPHTVKTHIKNIYKKLHVHSRASLVRIAINNHIV